ncbi:MAG TPA: low affinity iron permease family protein [Stellaceae bacterium]|nr:low affinity iron permease family protein [Stellaceae bacterium]
MRVEDQAPPPHIRKTVFDRLARWTERQAGRSLTFALASGVVAVWAVSGPFFHWSDTWQLVINTGTTIITFLMVFLIQNAHSRDTRAMNLKLDELIRVSTAANKTLIAAEQLSERDIEALRQSARSAWVGALPPDPVYLRVGEPAERSRDKAE